MRPFCSVIIPTIGRASLARAVNSALEQPFAEAPVEIIVVNDSGKPLPEEAWQASERVRLLQTERRERSFARNVGAAVARGNYLCFLDDDDWLLPGAFAAFWELAQRAPDAAWLYGGVRVVGAGGATLAERNSGLQGMRLAQIMGGAWAPIQSSIIRATDFFAVGGYSPFLLSTQDQDLCRKIAARGALANSGVTVACLFRGDNWKTSTAYVRATEDTRRSRHEVAQQAGTLRKMLASADSSYWYGRVVHLYLGLARWQLRQRRLAAVGYLAQAAVAALASLPHLLRRPFWQALGDEHVPGSLHFIQREWEEEGRGA